MPRKSLHQPHDKLFRFSFSQPATALAFFQAHLPKSWRNTLDLSSVELQPGTWVDSRYRKLESDLLFKVPSRQGPVFAYILLEHQRREDAWIALRLLIYMCRIWEQYRQDHPKARSLPVILPLVLAQQAGQWRQPTTFAALFKLPKEQRTALAKAIPNFTFQLVALAKLPFEKIAGTPMGVLTLRALKAQPLGGLLNEFVWDEALLQQLTVEERLMLLRYILELGELDEEQFEHKLEEICTTEIRRDVMTISERLIQKGRLIGQEEGRQAREEAEQKGILIGRIQLLQSFLKQTELPAKTLAKRSLSELQALHDKLQQALHRSDLS